MTLPVVHLNGTSAEALTDQYRKAYEALHGAMDAVRESVPNSRDYYCHPDGGLAAYDRAVLEHAARLERLQYTLNELHKLTRHCAKFRKRMCARREDA